MALALITRVTKPGRR